MKKTMLISLGAIAVLGIYFYLTHFSVPRHIQVLKSTCDLSVPYDAKLLHFKEDDNAFGGDFYVEIIIELKDGSLAELLSEAKKEGYKDLPIEDLLGGFAYDNYDQSDKGVYKIDQDGNTEKTILINATRAQLIVHIIGL